MEVWRQRTTSDNTQCEGMSGFVEVQRWLVQCACQRDDSQCMVQEPGYCSNNHSLIYTCLHECASKGQHIPYKTCFIFIWDKIIFLRLNQILVFLYHIFLGIFVFYKTESTYILLSKFNWPWEKLIYLPHANLGATSTKSFFRTTPGLKWTFYKFRRISWLSSLWWNLLIRVQDLHLSGVHVLLD